MPVPVLEMRNIHKHFGRTHALKGVDFDVLPGEAHALLGENGSGKSTLMKIAYGETRPTEGRVHIGQQAVTLHNPSQALRAGVTLVPQEVPLVNCLSVAENIVMGQLPILGGKVQWSRVHRQAQQLLEELEAPIDSRQLVGDVSPADRQLVAIARALSVEARLVIFDEPTSSLTSERTEALFRVIRRLKSRDLGIVFISQRLQDIQPVADRVTVIRDGLVVGTVPVAEATEASITRMMVGRSLDNYFHREMTGGAGAPGFSTSEDILQVDGLCVPGAFTDVSLRVKPGEVVGLAGLVGCGRVEVVRALFGACPSSGKVVVGGKEITHPSPRAGIKAGVAFLSGDRRGEGLVISRSVQENLTLVENRQLSLAPIRSGRQRSRVASLIDEVQLRPPRPDVAVATLSGGNQQKVALGKWLMRPPRLLLLDEPTRGVDVGAKSEIYRIIRDLAAHGTAVIVSSSENSELLGICDRVLMMFRGRVIAEAPATELDEWKVAEHVAGN